MGIEIFMRRVFVVAFVALAFSRFFVGDIIPTMLFVGGFIVLMISGTLFTLLFLVRWYRATPKRVTWGELTMACFIAIILLAIASALAQEFDCIWLWYLLRTLGFLIMLIGFIALRGMIKDRERF